MVIVPDDPEILHSYTHMNTQSAKILIQSNGAFVHFSHIWALAVQKAAWGQI